MARPSETRGRWATPDAYTVAELVTLLPDPPMTNEQIRALIKVTGIEPVGVTRHPTPRGGAPARLYPLGEVLAAHTAVAPLLIKREAS